VSDVARYVAPLPGSGANAHGSGLTRTRWPGMIEPRYHLDPRIPGMGLATGALFPVAGLSGWLAVLNRLDPLTYPVDPTRASCSTTSISARRAPDPG
jgi:hypothetical protein